MLLLQGRENTSIGVDSSELSRGIPWLIQRCPHLSTRSSRLGVISNLKMHSGSPTSTTIVYIYISCTTSSLKPIITILTIQWMIDLFTSVSYGTTTYCFQNCLLKPPTRCSQKRKQDVNLKLIPERHCCRLQCRGITWCQICKLHAEHVQITLQYLQS